MVPRRAARAEMLIHSWRFAKAQRARASLQIGWGFSAQVLLACGIGSG
eukprot:CAMPEP_0203866198 /NCGR_PEP_ID=MMETSP0359-20131031/15811_1 /ASSEMBLY_ACC=CAM_ASM_000338 /TAXON_ID=268821 /ORGANISM="Scrippsiella Hangoei, Strain SHTV-5" /LENGTH=47 /DNA_ID= /DNA_START= /DNA_END= /DNA_ORIENTATION=